MIVAEKVDFFDGGTRSICLDVATETGDVGNTYEWQTCLWKAHYPNSSPLSYLFKETGAGPLGIVALYTEPERILGVSVKKAKLLSGIYSTRGGAPLRYVNEEVVERLFEVIGSHFDWHVFDVCVEKSSEFASSAVEFSSKYAGKFAVLPYESAPFLELSGNTDDFLASKSRNFRSNLRRKEKRLAKAGDLQVQVVTRPGEVDKALAAIMAIENDSWKFQEGTAITSTPAVERFYRTLAKEMACRGWLRLYVMTLDGNPVAYDYGLLFEGCYSMLKTSYREQCKYLSPGVVLRWFVVRDLFEVGCKEHDFMWGMEPYKIQWSTGIREYSRLRFYRNHMAVSFMVTMKSAFDSLKKRVPEKSMERNVA